MPEAIKLWKSDSDGAFIELVVGQKKNLSIDLTDYWPGTETLNAPTWTGTAGVTFSGGGVDALVAQKYVQGVAVGEHACSVLLASASGNYAEPFAFRVIVRAPA